MVIVPNMVNTFNHFSNTPRYPYHYPQYNQDVTIFISAKGLWHVSCGVFLDDVYESVRRFLFDKGDF